jgi:Domain of unknown function (DUF1839)
VTASVLSLDIESWAPHRLHGPERVWPESNCYVDLWIGLLHALGFEPAAALGSALTMDLEGDQWTFVKIPPDELEALYGIVVKELTIWRSLIEHVQEQVLQRRLVLVEVDAFALPDTAGISYRTEHAKTTIAVEAIDVEQGRLRYFHNAGYYALDRADFEQLLPREPDSTRLPPYVEIVVLGRRTPRPTLELGAIARASLRRHVDRMPPLNPVTRYRARLAADVGWLRHKDLGVFHRYAFANFRQCGAAAEFGAAFLRWLEAEGEGGLGTAALHLDTLARGAKALQFQVARVVGSPRRIDPAPVLDTMEEAWASAATQLRAWRDRATRIPVGET